MSRQTRFLSLALVLLLPSAKADCGSDTAAFLANDCTSPGVDPCATSCKALVTNMSSSCTSEADKTIVAPYTSLCTECGSAYRKVMACVAIELNASRPLPLCNATCQPLACSVFTSCAGSSVAFLEMDGPGLANLWKNMSSQMSTCPCSPVGGGIGSGAMGSQTGGLASALLALLSLLSLLSL
ncbi:unnamed protein product [Polarella glacialis]|uniref:Uncharacterized protein n=1 Tax=Polarella glacialis TaxID=89957 RepID=A0A813E032_POLGL|nr:unnamed protein product [Polarella glacialis]CAE8638106.1 unnamed protein product [Polarella glacialis]